MMSKVGLRHYHAIVPATRLKHSFAQEPPRHENPYHDPFLIRNMKRILPMDAYIEIEDDLVKFGDRCITDIWTLGTPSIYQSV